MTSAPRVLLADSIGIFREGMASFVRRLRPDASIEHAGTVSEIKEAMRRGPWQLIVFNPALPADDGMGLIRLARAANMEAAILIVTLLSETQFGVAALAAGANGYVEAHASTREVLTAVEALLKGENYLSSRLQTLWHEHGKVRPVRNGFAALSTRERRVLRALADGSGVKQASLALGVSPSTIGTYRVRLLKKLELRTTADLIRYVAENRLDGGSNSPFGEIAAIPTQADVRRRVV